MRLLLVLLASFSAQARVMTLSVAVTGDLGGVINGGESAPGWAAVLQDVRREEGSPDGEIVWLDLGNHGMSDCALACLGAGKPDAVLPGLMEYEQGVSQWPMRYRTEIPLLCANAFVLPQYPAESLPFAASRLIERRGLRIQITAVADPATALWVPRDALGPLAFSDPVELLSREMPALRAEAADLRVLMVQVLPGTENAELLERLSTSFPEFDLLVSGANAGATFTVLAKRENRPVRMLVRAQPCGRQIPRVLVRYDTLSRRIVAMDTAEPRAAFRDHVDMEPPLPACARQSGTVAAGALDRFADDAMFFDTFVRAACAATEADVVLFRPWTRSDPGRTRHAEAVRSAWMPQPPRWRMLLVSSAEFEGLLTELHTEDEAWRYAGNAVIRNGSLRGVDGSVFPSRRVLRVLVDSRMVAGEGGAAIPLRRWMDARPLDVEEVTWSSEAWLLESLK